MQTISHTTSLWIKIALFILTALGAGTLFVPSFISPVVAKDIAGMSLSASILLNGVFLILTTDASPPAPPVSPTKIAAFALFGLFVTLTLFQPSPVSAKEKGVPLPPRRDALTFPTLPGNVLTGNPVADLNKAFSAIQSISLADLQAAKDDAIATKDDLGSSCYLALINLVTAQQSVDLTKLEDKPHAILTFQRGRDLFNALRPGSPVSVGCAPLAEQVKMDITTLIASIAAGTVTMAAFGL